ncbi:MAG: hypothetical protein IKP10_05700 [Clostridia bacterium]|nr:hypothetical protein [Clostridia bacterium]
MARRPRVMSLREVKRIRTIADGCVWLETGGAVMPVFMEQAAKTVVFLVGTAIPGYRSWFDCEWYNKTWRIWTLRPSDADRLAAGWDLAGHYEDLR